MSEIVKDRVFYEESGGGVTFSGGEPLMQDKFLIESLKECNTLGIHSAVDTSGYTSEGVIDRVSKYADLFLYDLKLMNDDVHQKYTGVSNQIILKNLVELDQLGKKIVIRIPIVPEITDTNENLFAIRGFISYLNNVIEVNLLPYHRAGEGKYIKYGRENKMGDTVSPERKNLENIRDFLVNQNIKLKLVVEYE